MASDALRHQVAARWQESFARLNRNEQGISGLVTFSEAWGTALNVLYPRRLDEPKEIDMIAARTAFSVVNAGRRLPFFLETFLENVKKQFYLVERDVQDYMARFDAEEDPQIMQDLILRLAAWLKHWAPFPEYAFDFHCLICFADFCRLGPTMYSAFALSFQTHLFSIVPPHFARGFKVLVASILAAFPSPYVIGSTELLPDAGVPNAPLWQAFDKLGLIDRYETIIATVGYEFIEQHVLETYAGEWSRPILSELHNWMAEKFVPWMVLVYARNASNGMSKPLSI